MRQIGDEFRANPHAKYDSQVIPPPNMTAGMIAHQKLYTHLKLGLASHDYCNNACFNLSES